jgi:hypothetical protein
VRLFRLPFLKIKGPSSERLKKKKLLETKEGIIIEERGDRWPRVVLEFDS